MYRACSTQPLPAGNRGVFANNARQVPKDSFGGSPSGPTEPAVDDFAAAAYLSRCFLAGAPAREAARATFINRKLPKDEFQRSSV